jgi:hypothetical protein
VGLKLIGTRQILAHADVVNLLEDDTGTIRKNIETLIDANREVCVEIDTQKTKCMLLSHHQNAEKN